MPREIKFRAWDGHRFVSPDNYHLDLHGNVWWEFGYNEPKLVKEEDLVLMQFTGLKDRNGKEIYEGDIVQRYFKDIFGVAPEKDGEPTGIFAVRFDEDELCFMFGDSRLGAYGFANPPLKVIGNIYENTELLEQTKC